VDHRADDAMTDYVVTSSRLYLVDDDGNRTGCLRGDTVTGLPEGEVKRLKAAGAIAAVSSGEAKAAVDDPELLAPGELSDGDPTTPSHTGMPDPSASELLAVSNSAPAVPAVERPAKTARVEAWRTYAVSVGAVTEGEADDMDKAALVKAVDVHENPSNDDQ
jgi:hypothetical protein